MIRIPVLMMLFLMLPLWTMGVHASDFLPPAAPKTAAELMPDDADNLEQGMKQMISQVFPRIKPIFSSALKSGLAVYSCVLLISIFRNTQIGFSPAELAGTVIISSTMLRTSHSMISLASETITEITEYSKLFLPVLSAASAAQGAVTSSAAIYIATSFFTSFLSISIRRVMLPAIYLFLVAAIASSAIGEQMLTQLKEQIKKFSVWFLKTALSVFLTYLSLTGTVTGTADKSAVKAAKAAISTVVPVIGSSLANASEALLISIGVMKNAIGIYGIFVFLAIFLFPFITLSVHYLVLKGTAALCTVPDVKRLSDLIGDFGTAMGLLLGITGTICALSLIGTVCFMRGMI